jgi:hypothetical protein
LKQFDYTGVDRRGRTVSGSTMAKTERDVEAQLLKFGFKNIRISDGSASASAVGQTDQAAEPMPADYVQKLIDGDIEIEAPAPQAEGKQEEEADEWRRAEVLARVRKYRRRESIVLTVTLIIVGALAAYFVYNKITEIDAPQPKIVKRTSNALLSLEDVHVENGNLVFVVNGRNWNGNVRVDYRAWDAFGEKVDFGLKRMGFIGDHFRGSATKSGAFRLKKYRYYDRIEIVVSGDEGK